MKIPTINLYKGDCLDLMKSIHEGSIDMVLADIPYDAVSRGSNGLRKLDKGIADILTFDIQKFLDEVHRITKNSAVIFCGKEQFSSIYQYFASKEGTVRPIIWEKSNPSPMNGQYVYLSGVEMAVWFKKKGGKVLTLIVRILSSRNQTEEAKCTQLKRTWSYSRN